MVVHLIFELHRREYFFPAHLRNQVESWLLGNLLDLEKVERFPRTDRS